MDIITGETLQPFPTQGPLEGGMGGGSVVVVVDIIAGETLHPFPTQGPLVGGDEGSSGGKGWIGGGYHHSDTLIHTSLHSSVTG